MKIKLGEKEYDLEKSLPVTLGDIRRLKQDHGVKLDDLNSMDIDVVAKVLLLLCQKVDPAITEALVDTVPLMELGRIANFLAMAASPDFPTSGSSTS